MQEWLAFAPTALAALAWLVLPGTLLGFGLRLRLDSVLLYAPFLSLAIISTAAILAPIAALPWGPAAPALLTLILAAAVWIPRIILARRTTSRSPAPTTPLRPHTVARGRRLTGVYGQTLIALGVGAALMGTVLVATLDTPYAFSQTYDAIFHLNAIRWVLDTADASSLHLLQMVKHTSVTSFYPSAWHGLASLALITVGADDVRVGTNAAMIATAAYAWPASMLAFIRAWTPGPIVRYALVPSAVFCAAMPSFPYLFLTFGVLYPNFLGYVLIPGYLALIGALLGHRRRLHLSWPSLIVVGLGASVAIVLAHPSAAMSSLVAAIALSVGYAVSYDARRRWYLPLVYLAIAGILYLVVAITWPIIRPAGPSANSWPPLTSLPAAMGETIFLLPLGGLPLWSVMIPAALGIVAAIRYREYTVLVLWAVFAFLYVVVAAWPDGPGRTAIVGVWYSDARRLAALIPMAAIPLASMGAAYTIARIRRIHVLRSVTHAPWLPGAGVIRAARRGWATLVLMGIVAAGLAAITQYNPQLRAYRWEVSEHYQLVDSANLVSVREMELIDTLTTHVEPDALVYTNPLRGEALVYAFTGLDTTSRHVSEWNSSDEALLDQRLNQIDTDPQVCEAINNLGVQYAVIFLGPTVNDFYPDTTPGLVGVSRTEKLTLLEQRGGAYLYEVTGCD